MAESSDVAVVGGGIVGLATAVSVLDQGASVTVYEVGAPGNGQSGGVSRIFRHAHDDPRLVAFAKESRQIYRDWGERFGTELVSPDGAVAIGPSVEDRLPVLEQVGGVDARRIDAAELAQRLPLLAGFDGPVMLDADGGSIRTRATVDALVGALGDRLVMDEVLAVRSSAGGAEVRAGGVVSAHDRVVVCAGRGTAPLARGIGLSLPVSLEAHVRLTFAVRGEPPRTLACLQDSSGVFGESGVYAAAAPGNTHYAVGLSDTAAVNPDASVIDPAALTSLAGRARSYVERALPGLDPAPVDVRSCWVTELPWSSDSVAVWEADRVLVVAGHNLFKQAPALGRALATAAVGGRLDDALRPESRLGAVPSHDA